MPSARRIRALSPARIVECLDSTFGVLVNGLKSPVLIIQVHRKMAFIYQTILLQ